MNRFIIFIVAVVIIIAGARWHYSRANASLALSFDEKRSLHDAPSDSGIDAAGAQDLVHQTQNLGRQEARKSAADGHPDPAPTVDFKSDSSTDLKNGEQQTWARVEKGTSNGLPASRLILTFGGTIVVARAAAAHEWDEARAACRKLSPAGSWDLPTDEDYLTLLMSKAVDVKISLPRGAIYPMWLRFKDESKNTAMFAGKPTLATMTDGHGEDLDPVDAGPETIAAMRKDLTDVEQQLQKELYRSDADNKRVDDAVKEYNRRKGSQTFFNLDMPHPGELPADVNAILEKPSKERLVENQESLKKLIGSFENGYPAYCAAH